MRVLAVDFGDARTGVALSDITRTVVGETRVFTAKGDELLHNIVGMCKDVDQVLVGFPKNMNGTLGERAAICENFAKKLQNATNLSVRLVDERLTTVQAHRILKENKRSNHKKTVDAVAAALILESFLSGLDKGGNSHINQ